MDTYDKVFELAKNRGFIWPSFEIYGGASGFYDYGPMGATFKRKIEDAWRRLYCVGEGFYEIEVPTIGVEAVFEASGHVGGFADPMTTCRECGGVVRASSVPVDNPAAIGMIILHGSAFGRSRLAASRRRARL